MKAKEFRQLMAVNMVALWWLTFLAIDAGRLWPLWIGSLAFLYNVSTACEFKPTDTP